MKRKRIEQAFSFPDLRKVVGLEKEDFARYATRHHTTVGNTWFYKDNGSNVLAVAHLDSVQKSPYCGFLPGHPAGDLIFCPRADDRMGAYVILEWLPKLGITCDWLLTDEEEMGRSTAQFFRTEKRYNWMFQFDRTGDDVVMYQYENDDMVALLKRFNFTVGVGSSSDIRKLSKLGCRGFNFGTAYYEYHGMGAHVKLDVLISQLTRFVRFYWAQHRRHLVYDPRLEGPDWIDKRTDSSWKERWEYNEEREEWVYVGTKHRSGIPTVGQQLRLLCGGVEGIPETQVAGPERATEEECTDEDERLGHATAFATSEGHIVYPTDRPILYNRDGSPCSVADAQDNVGRVRRVETKFGSVYPNIPTMVRWKNTLKVPHAQTTNVACPKCNTELSLPELAIYLRCPLCDTNMESTFWQTYTTTKETLPHGLA